MKRTKNVDDGSKKSSLDFRQIITVRKWFRSKELKEERQKIVSFISFVTTTNRTNDSLPI